MSRPRIAVIGLGDIAEKAYLPVLAARDDVSLVLVTRNAATLARLGAQYRLPEQYTQLAPAIAAGLDGAFVHAATQAHGDIVSELIRFGVPVFVDKPLAYSYRDCAALVEQARTAGVGLMVGFNRRYAPAYREIADWPQRDVVVMQKNRAGPLEDPRQSVFDDFIHVVDTVRFLGPAVKQAAVTGEVVDGTLRHVSITLTDGHRGAVGIMSRVAGMTDECLEVLGPGRKRRVVNMSEIIDFDGAEQTTRRDEWRSVGVQRGFAPMCESFLAGLRGRNLPDVEDALLTHGMCEDIVTALAH
ncbi:MAG: Gfo/Idh/MocA family oxidoreductase [Mycobacteriales bacterium]